MWAIFGMSCDWFVMIKLGRWLTLVRAEGLVLFLACASGLRVFVICYWILPSLCWVMVLWSSIEGYGMFFCRILLTHQSKFRPLTGVIHIDQCLVMYKLNAQVPEWYAGGRVFVWMDWYGYSGFLVPVRLVGLVCVCRAYKGPFWVEYLSVYSFWWCVGTSILCSGIVFGRTLSGAPYSSHVRHILWCY
jgi:hypothetical protein